MPGSGCCLTKTHLPVRAPDALHLNPVTQTFQLRPSLTYLDNLLAFERRAKREAARNDDVSDEEISDTELKKEEAKAVQVSIKSGEQAAKGPLGGGNGRAGAGLFAPLRAEEAEEWKPIKHFHANVSRSVLTNFSSIKLTRLNPVHVLTDERGAQGVGANVCSKKGRREKADEHDETERIPLLVIPPLFALAIRHSIAAAGGALARGCNGETTLIEFIRRKEYGYRA